MSLSPAKKVIRPLSPHLQVYRPQLTSMTSIFNRMTGVGLTLGLPVLVWWLYAAASGPEAFAAFNACASSLIGKLLFTGWAWAFCYHLCAGLRHLAWDAGKGLEIKAVYASGYVLLIVSTLMSAMLWSVIWGTA